MNGKTVSSMLFICILAMGIFVSSAQSNDVYEQQMNRLLDTSASRYDQMNAVKSHIAAILKENKELETQYNSIKNEVNQMKGETSQYADIARRSQRGLSIEMPEMVVSPTRYRQDESPMVEDLSSEYQLNVSAGGAHRLQELFLADLVYQKRALELELQLRKFTYEQQHSDIKKEYQDLENRLRDNLIMEKKLSVQINDIEKDRLIAADEIPKLEYQNKEMAFNLEELQRKLDFQTRETQIIKDKILLAERNKDRIAFDKVEKKSRLQNEVDILEENYSRINSQVKLFLSRQARKQELIKSIIEYDQQNQEITGRIEKLKLKLGRK